MSFTAAYESHSSVVDHGTIVRIVPIVYVDVKVAWKQRSSSTYIFVQQKQQFFLRYVQEVEMQSCGTSSADNGMAILQTATVPKFIALLRYDTESR